MTFETFYTELTSDERWVELRDYEGQYSINHHGKIMRLEHKSRRMSVHGFVNYSYTSQVMKPYKMPDGYLRVVLKGVSFPIHRLVALNFVDNPENKPFVNHLDHDRSNNYYKNLEWCTQKENINHAVQSGRMAGQNAKLTKQQVIEIRALPRQISSREVGIIFNISSSVIRHIRQGKAWKHI